MPTIERSTGNGSESKLDLIDQDISAIVDTINQGTDVNSIPDKSIPANKLSTLRGSNAFFFGTVTSNSWFNDTIFINVTGTSVAANSAIFTASRASGQVPFISTAMFDLFVNPTGVTSSMTPSQLQTNLYAGNFPYPQSNQGFGTGQPPVAGIGGGGGSVALVTNDQVIFSWWLSNSMPAGQIAAFPGQIQKYVISVYNQTGASADMYIAASFGLINPAIFS